MITASTAERKMVVYKGGGEGDPNFRATPHRAFNSLTRLQAFNTPRKVIPTLLMRMMERDLPCC
ncbi:RNA 2,3-cyclic phosphodiesterase [Sesbania bispinosa]|nr:RNA 2,3-cyclic phosphodiesterase [Sesbania bispinosa]